MVEKLKAEIKGSLIYWVCDSQSDYVQFNIALKYDPEGSEIYFRKKKTYFQYLLGIHIIQNHWKSEGQRLKIIKKQMCIILYDILKALKQSWQMPY